MRVSVIIPCYNQGEFLRDALESVYEQSFQNFECIIVNDGSTDKTEDIVKNWNKLDSRFKYFHKGNGGLSQARNFGIEKSSGEFILPLDADDYLSPDYIQSCLDEFEETDPKLVYGKVVCFGSRHGEWDMGNYSYEKLLFTNMIHCSAMFRKTDWSLVGGYDETMLKGLEDWEFWIRLLNPDDDVTRLEQASLYYRIKENSMISIMSKDEEIKIKKYVFRKHADIYYPYYANLFQKNKHLVDVLNDWKHMFVRFVKLIIGERFFKKLKFK